MGAWAFHGMQEKVCDEVEILPVELPGRNSRMTEAKPTSLEATASSMVAGLLDAGCFNKPYVFFGHSMGAWMAYEAARMVVARRLPLPAAVVVSGARGAQLADDDSDTVELGSLPTSESFWEHFERRYGKNPDLQSTMIRDYVEPLLRADFRALEAYRPETTQLSVPIFACGARGDERCTQPQLEAWGALTTATFEWQLFDVRPLPWSTPHRYVVEDPAPLAAFFTQLATTLRQTGPYVVASKKGALVREAIDLDSPQVEVLPTGAVCDVVDVVHPAGGLKPRARIETPVQGWVSLHVLAPQK